jgi:thiol:disulfide interchange protein
MFNKTQITFFLFFSILLSNISLVKAQEAIEEPVSFQIEVPKTVEKGKNFTVSVVFNIQSGLYVYAPLDINRFQGKIPTKVTFELHDTLKKVGNLELPDLSKGYLTYEGKGVRMTQKFKVPNEMESGKQTIKATIVYQACNEMFCYPPVENKIIIEVEVK